MINIQLLKKYILFFVFTASAIVAKAQAGYNYYEWGVGAEASYERGYTNVPRQDNDIGFAGKFIYNYNPYLPIELEVQGGHLSGGGLTVLEAGVSATAPACLASSPPARPGVSCSISRRVQNLF